jgi:diguanylate cyclase (GGDEF)-like protein
VLAQRPTRWLLAAGTTLVFVGLLVFQGLDVARSEGRRTGVEIDQGNAAIAITRVVPGLAADRAGVRQGDEVLWLDGMRTVKVGDWDLAAADFSPDRPVHLTVRRDGRELDLTFTPGAPYPWIRVGTNAVAVLGYLGLVLLVLLQEKRDLRTRLLLLFSLAVAVELVLPIGSIGSYDLLIWVFSGYFLLTGFEIGVELHLAALIPERPDWLRRHRWVVPGFYAFGLSFGGLAAATFLLEDIAGLDPFPWTSGQIEEALLHLALPLWALGVAALLAVPTFSHPQPRKRQQAALVLMGVLPWVLWILVSTMLDQAGVLGNLYWAQTLESLVLLCYPVAVFVAIFRYHLFDIELAVRRSLLYGTLTGALILLFYAALGAGGAIFSQIVQDGGSVWVVAGATLVLGLLFAPLMRSLQRWIDRRLFPERHALRAHLVALASELPSLGKLPLMGDHLVSRISGIFSCRSAALLIADPSADVLSLLAARRPPHGEELDRSLLLPLQDPALVALRRMHRPVPVDAFRDTQPVEEESSVLLQRLELLDGILLVPLMSHDRLVGLLLLGPRVTGQHYRGEELELLDLLSLHVASVFENARLFESATYESLTGLLRREAILEQLDLELQRALRYRRPLTIGLADLDHFKNVNDDHGHLVGDSLLKRIARAIQLSLRTTDAVGRYGGEEFLLVLPETDLRGAQAVAEKVRTAVQGCDLPLEDGDSAAVTISIGLATLDDHRREGYELVTARDLLAAADRSLYRAKGAGRNRVHPLLTRAS